ncbi:MAG: sulfatase, partial [Verrucomicrobiota bacterium]
HGGAGRPDNWDEVMRGGGGGQREAAPNQGTRGIKWAALDCADEETGDYRIASWASEKLGQKHSKPFFLAVGFHKPHMPWNVPRKYFDLYPLDRIELPPHRADDLADVPPEGLKMAKPDGDHAEMVRSGKWKQAVQAYLAAISYLDAQVGRVIEALDRGPNASNTLICFWGDHGWHLGEKEHWRKFALWEEATRAPFIWVVPGVTRPGGVCSRPVDFMSIYPTLCDLTGIDRPAHVEGLSIRKLLADPKAEWTAPALTTFHRNNHSLRSESWRYIRYAEGGEELYDHRNDPYEWTNLAHRPEHAALKTQLSEWLPKVNREERPRNASRP